MGKLRLGFSALMIAAVAGAALASPSGAGLDLVVRRVVPVGGVTTGTCHDWANDNACDLQYALSLTSDEIWIKAGVYKPTSGTDRNATFNIPPGVAVYGGFAGIELAREARDPAANVTILSGDIDGNDIQTNDVTLTWNGIQGFNSYHVVTMDGTTIAGSVTSTTRLDGFTITGGDSGGGNGGGLQCLGNGSGHECSPTLENLTFSGNQAGWGGGLVNFGYNGGASSPALKRVNFNGNRATAYGGAVTDFGDDGGTSNPTFTEVSFLGNRAEMAGGAVYNKANGPGESSPTFSNVTFANNVAMTNGGAVYNFAVDGVSSPSFSNVTFDNNSAAHGGAMHNWVDGGTTSPTLRNVTFHANSATYGGAICNQKGAGTSSASYTNVIMWDDTATNGPELYNGGATPTISHSDIEGCMPSGVWDDVCGDDGGGNIDADPLFNTRSNTGGFTSTITLGLASPAVDAGDDTTCGGYPVSGLDQRGITRPLDGDGDGAAVCDMGATESKYAIRTIRSLAADDGWVLESGENTSVGGTVDASDTTFRLGDNVKNRQYRAILSFSTGSLPDNAEFVSVKLKIKQSSLVGGNPFSDLGTLRIDMRRGTFGGGAALTSGDFQAAAHRTNAGAIPNSPSSGWYTKSLSGANFGYINVKGKSQLRLYFATGDNNNDADDYFEFYSGDAATSSKPKVIITYYAP